MRKVAAGLEMRRWLAGGRDFELLRPREEAGGDLAFLLSAT